MMIAGILEDGQTFIGMMLARNMLSHCYDFERFREILNHLPNEYLPALENLYDFFWKRSTMNEFGLSDIERKMMQSVLKKYPFVVRATIFGSRAKGTYTPRSDVDIALFGNISPLQAEKIALDMDELPTPYRFDMQAYSAIKNALLKDHKRPYQPCRKKNKNMNFITNLNITTPQ